MPPVMGAAAFLMAEFLEAPYSAVIVSALVPSILYYFSVFIQADLEAARKNNEERKEDPRCVEEKGAESRSEAKTSREERRRAQAAHEEG